MFNFFVDEKNSADNSYIITDKDFNHLKNVLRKNIGDEILISSDGKSDLCVIEKIEEDRIKARIIQKEYQSTELNCEIYLFQGLPKSDKMEFIIQKSVELGVKAIIPTEMTNCVAKLDDKKKLSKQARWQSIAESAAKQSKRNIIPSVCPPLSFKSALQKLSELDLILVPYENKNGMTATLSALREIKENSKIGIIIGPEGGFDEKEIDALKEIGGKIISLGKRILRTETAAVSALSMCMLYCEIKEDSK